MILAYVREIPSKKQVIFSHLSCPRFLRILSRYNLARRYIHTKKKRTRRKYEKRIMAWFREVLG